MAQCTVLPYRRGLPGMRWQLTHSLAAPAATLPRQTRAWPATASVQDFCLGFDPMATAGIPFLTDEPGLRLYPAAVGWVKTRLPPLPWSTLFQEPPEGWQEKLTRLELACRLKCWAPPAEPLTWEQVDESLAYSDETRRQAFALALFDLSLPVRRPDPVLDRWTTAVREVIGERLPINRSPNTGSPLLDAAYHLLVILSGLRSRRDGLLAFEHAWATLFHTPQDPPPLAFAIVYWGEAAYCLTEQGDMVGADKLLARQIKAVGDLLAQLPLLEESLRGGLWQHHLGRLAYYRGDFGMALEHFAREWSLRGERRDALDARLYRNIGNVLSDIGILDGAQRVTDRAEEIQLQLADPELYKTLGRLGEIAARRGEYDQARGYYTASWEQQQALPRGPEDGRTAVYLGNLATLAGNLEEAELWFQQASQVDKRAGIAFNPYAIMGQVALAARRGDKAKLTDLWSAHAEALLQLGGEKVLPAAVAALAFHGSGVMDDGLLTNMALRLIEEQYVIEALPLLHALATRPGDQAEPLRKIATILQGWNQAIESLPRAFIQWSGIRNGHREWSDAWGILAAVESARQGDTWTPLEDILPRIFPACLVIRS